MIKFTTLLTFILVILLLTACGRNPTTPTITEFTSSSTTITSGDSATLNWIVAGTKPIDISITNLGNLTDTSINISPLTTKTYTLTATNLAGTVSKDLTITVTPPPVPPTITSFTSSPKAITKGDSSILKWVVTGTEPINISITSLDNLTGNSISVSPITTKTYTLIAENLFGKVTKDVTITVNNIITKFAAFGDTPYYDNEFPKIINIFNQVANNHMPFIVHVGDIFSSGTNCNQALYETRRALFNQSPVPFLITIGDNEHIDCPNSNNALNLFRTIILDTPTTTQVIQGADPTVKTITVTRPKKMIENAAWDFNNIEFIMVNLSNLPGNYPLPNSTIKQILNSNLVFIKERFTQATTQNRSAIVLIMHSDPSTFGCTIIACKNFNNELVSLVKTYGKPVLSINGDNHFKSFKNGGYQNINNWWNLRPGGYARGWAEISFSSKNNRFSVKWY